MEPVRRADQLSGVISAKARATKQFGPHPEERPSGRVSKDGSESVPCIHPSRRAQERAPQDEVANVSHALSRAMTLQWIRPIQPVRASISRIVFRELVLEFLHGRNRIDTHLADIVGPGLLQWLGGLLPLGELSLGERINVVACLGLYLGNAVMLELAPRPAALAGDLGGAIVVDRLLLPGRHLVVSVPVEHEGESGDV